LGLDSGIAARKQGKKRSHDPQLKKDGAIRDIVAAERVYSIAAPTLHARR
jgi:hypothetical protein